MRAAAGGPRSGPACVGFTVACGVRGRDPEAYVTARSWRPSRVFRFTIGVSLAVSADYDSPACVLLREFAGPFRTGEGLCRTSWLYLGFVVTISLCLIIDRLFWTMLRI